MTKKNRLYNLAVIIFGILFFLFPTLMIIITRKQEIFIPLILASLILIIIYFSKRIKLPVKVKKQHLLIIILILAFVLRLISSIIFQDIKQVSDFGIAFKTAATLKYTSYHRLYPHWILLPKILHGIFAIFGSSQLVLGIFNSIIATLTCALIYLISKMINNNQKFALISSFIYAIYPSSIIYINFCTNEHIASLLICLSIFLIFKLDIIHKYQYKLGIAGLIGVILALSNGFKQLSLIIIVALAIYYILAWLKEKNSFMKVIQSIGIYITIIIIFSFSNNLLFKYYDYLTQSKVSRSATAYFLTVGLNSNSKGLWDATIANNYKTKLKKYNYDFDKVNKELYASLKLDLINNFSKIIHNLPDKMNIALAQDKDIVYWLIEMNKDKGRDNLLYKLTYVTDNFYLLIVIFGTIGLFVLLKGKTKNNKLIFLYVIIFGFCLLMLISEVQSRYKYPLIPIYTILASYGIYNISFKEDEKKQAVN